MTTPALPDDGDEFVIRFLGPGPFLICGEPGVIKGSYTLRKDVPTKVPREVAEWALGMNVSRQAEVFELVDQVEGATPKEFDLVDEILGIGGEE